MSADLRWLSGREFFKEAHGPCADELFNLDAVALRAERVGDVHLRTQPQHIHFPAREFYATIDVIPTVPITAGGY